MKKIIASLMALTLALALTACDGDTTGTSSAPTSTASPSTSTSSAAPSAPSENTSSEPEAPSLNLALNGTPIANGVRDDNTITYGMPNMNDGNTLTLWQAATRENDQKESEEDPSWFGISWEEAQTFDTLYVLWEQAHPTPDGFRIEISDDGETWTEVEFTSVRGGTSDETLTGGLEPDKQTDDIVLNEVVTTKNIRVVCFTYYTMPDNAPEYPNDPKTPTGVYEFEIYNSADLEAEGETSSEAASDETAAE